MLQPARTPIKRDRFALLVERGARRCTGRLAAVRSLVAIRRLCSQHGVGVLQRQRLPGAQRFAFGLDVELVDLLGHEREAID
jgi:hypothetical protein